jgi:hypothetical protein
MFAGKLQQFSGSAMLQKIACKAIAALRVSVLFSAQESRH